VMVLWNHYPIVFSLINDQVILPFLYYVSFNIFIYLQRGKINKRKERYSFFSRLYARRMMFFEHIFRKNR
jgi:hypothetical protein